MYQECHNGALSSGLGTIVPQANLCGKEMRESNKNLERGIFTWAPTRN